MVESPSLLTTAFAVLFVAVLRQGVVGSLRANLLGSAIAAVVSLILAARMCSLGLSWTKLRCALRFSLPLVPHTAASWALSLSDRFVLEKHVATAQIGLYLLGHQFGALTLLAASSINSALVPIVNAHLDSTTSRDEVPRLGTYAFIAIVFAGVSVAVLGSEAILWLTPARYHGATRVVPWIAAGFTLHGAYFILSRGSFYAMNTARIPFLTATAAALNIGLNVAFIPRFGIMAAAVNMTVSYGVLAAMNAWVAHKLYPIPWQYRRMAWILAIGVTSAIVGLRLPPTAPWVPAKVAVVLLGFPGLLVVARVVSREEVERIRNSVRGLARRPSRPYTDRRR